MKLSFDVVILGGGIIGLTIAHFLAKAGQTVAVLDPRELGQEASWAGAGMLPAGNPRKAHTPMGQLRSRGTALFAEYSQELRATTGIDNGYRNCGGLEILRSPDALDRRRQLKAVLDERDAGVDHEVLDGPALRGFEPSLAPDLPGALYFPGDAQIRNPWHLRAVTAACVRAGVALFPNHPIQEITRKDERITNITAGGGSFAAGEWVIAAGAWSTHLLAELGQPVALAPVRGQIVLLRSPLRLKPIIAIKGEYLVPRGDGLILVGSTEEHVGFEKGTTPEAVDHLLAFARRLVPGLAAAAVERTWSGLRPGTPDDRPYLGRVPGWRNVSVAAGHFRAGLQLSIITAVLIKQVLLGEVTSLDLQPFRVDRPPYERFTFASS